jgi:predicted aspartyl protease
MNVGRMPQPIQLAGAAETVDIYTLGYVNLAGEPAPAPITVILDAPMKYVREARGILGMNVLSRFAIDIDQPNQRLIVHEAGALPMQGHDWTVRKTEKRADFFLIVEAEVQGVKARALIDTGANETILNAELAAELGIVEGAPGVSPGNVKLTKVPSLKATVDTVALGAAEWSKLEVQAADLPLFDALGLGDGPALVLGNDALKQVRLFIDYAGGQVYLTPPFNDALIGAGDGGPGPDNPAIETP